MKTLLYIMIITIRIRVNTMMYLYYSCTSVVQFVAHHFGQEED